MDFEASNHMTSHGEWFKDTRFEDTRVCGNWWWHYTSHHTNWQGAIVHVRWVNKVLEICTSCSNHNKKIGLRMLDGGIRFISDIQPKWMFCGIHEKPKKIDCKKGKEWTNVHLGCEHVWGEFHVIHTWRRN